MKNPMCLTAGRRNGGGRGVPPLFSTGETPEPQLFGPALTVCALLLAVSNLSAATLYVSLGSTNPTPPYATWATAATNIQNAVDAAGAGDTVVVNDGSYGWLTVNKPLAVRSVNGQDRTSIQGGVSGSSQASLSGFTLVGGGPSKPGVGASGVTLRDCTVTGFFQREVGGAAYCTLYNCTLAGNSAHGAAGALSCTLYNCALNGNNAMYGGGGAAGCTLYDCTLSGNNAGGSGGGASGCTLSNCTLSGNSAVFDGGGADGCTLYNCELAGNSAGGGMVSPHGAGAAGCTLYNCTLTGNGPAGAPNMGPLTGGGAYSCTLSNCTVSGNTGSGASTCQLYDCVLASNAGPGADGCTLSNCTVAGNTGGGTSGCTNYNSIVYFNSAQGWGEGGNVSGCTMNWCCTPYVAPTNGVGNITNAPLFVDYAGRNLRLQPNSPCINAGNNAYVSGTTDLAGNPRIVEGTVDIGAYEFQGPTYGPPVVARQPPSQTNDAGTTVTFIVSVRGSPPLGFQWGKDGVPLAEGGNRAGAATATLTLTNVLRADAGGYRVVVSNGLGSVTSAVAMLAVLDPAIAVQPASQLGQSGRSVTLSVIASGTPPLEYQWWKGDAALAGGTGASLNLTNVQAADGGQYYVVVGSQCGTVTSAVALLTVFTAATLDTSFDPGADNNVFSLALQADGKILVGGDFTTLGGQSRNSIGRLNDDGTVDTSFNPGAGPRVGALAVQADGRILVGGDFTTLGGQSRNCIGRLNADGTVDMSFNPGANNPVVCLALQADGKILVGGGFTTLGGQSHGYIGRLNADGTVDASFNTGANDSVETLALQADGKILVGAPSARWAGKATFSLAGSMPTGRWIRASSRTYPGAPGTRTTTCLPWRHSRTARFWQGATSAVWTIRPHASTSAGSMPMGPWTPPSIRGQTIQCVLWRCRRTARFWWAVPSAHWAAKAAMTLAGSMPMGRWTRPSVWGQTLTCAPWHCRRTGSSW